MHKNKSKKKINYDWNCLLYNDDVKTAYAVKVRNRFEALQTANDNETSDTISSNIIEAHKEAVIIHISKKTEKKIPLYGRMRKSKQNSGKSKKP